MSTAAPPPSSPSAVLLRRVREWHRSDSFDETRWQTWLDGLADPLREMIERSLSAKSVDGWRAHPAAMMYHLTKDDWWLRPHVDFLSRDFADLMNTPGARRIWNLPGRYGKTRTAQAGLIWNLDRAPSSRSIVHSYVIDLASLTSVEVRDTIRLYRQIGTRPAPGRAEQNRWFTVDGGGILAASWGSRVVGFGITEDGLLLIDDPFKNWQEAHNDANRDRVWSEYTGTLRHRLDSEDAPILGVWHRMHKKDLNGMLKAAEEQGGEKFEVVSLPAIATSDQDPLGRAVGDPLDPLQFPLDKIHSRQRGMTSYVASAIEQQDPQEPEGNKLKRKWFRIDEVMPERWDAGVLSWDLKLKNAEEGDFVVGQAWVRTGTDFWLLDQLRGQWDHATTANAICLLRVRHPRIRQTVVEAAGAVDDVTKALKPQPDYELSEDIASQLGMTEEEREKVQTLRRRGLPGIVRHKATGQKVIRAESYIAPPAEAGNVHLNAYGPWLAVWLDEIAAFPSGDYDDQVDAASQALDRLDTSGGSVSTSAKSRRRVAAAPPTPASGRVVAPRRRS